MEVAVMADGEWDSSWGRVELEKNKPDVLICADGGANLALSSRRIPDVVVGDLDSITENNLRLCLENNTKIKKFPAEKDQTDLELALEFAEEYLQIMGRPEDEIQLYAAGGKRIDHLLGNIAIMLGFARSGRRVRMIDRSFTAWVVLSGKESLKGSTGQLLSIIPLSEAARVSSLGLYYELDNLVLLQSSPRGISNVFRGEKAEIEVLAGAVLVIMLNET